ncbi:prenyltransferase [Leifsonia xyli]|uniref:prenyltransferase n=1 Tax=Leifsonia xyli TaxID=1575 RepID=UPI001969DD7A
MAAHAAAGERRVTAVAPAAPLRQLVLASRPLSWINTAFPFAAAYLLTTGRVDATFVIGTLFFLIPYNLAMYGINDVFDYESDLRNPRKGGAEGALLDRSAHRRTLIAAVVTTVPFVIYLVIVGSPLSWLVLAVSLFAVVAYSVKGLRFKEVPFLDSVTSSTHFTSPALYGLVLAGATFTPALWLVLLAFFLWGIGSHAFGAVQDVMPDREGGISSIATAIGAAATVRLAIAAWALAGVAMLFTPWPGPLAAVLALPYIAAAAPFWSVTDERSGEANRGWRRFLWINYACGFVVTMLLILWAAVR